ncbi:MAG: HAD hydrolase family protein, partial [Solobacterium sp.]|nr:HAD hydrolase family protein [Solobacterium sp.]
MSRLIASDLDGTIINEHNACDPSVAEAIAHYRSCGVRFAVCS